MKVEEIDNAIALLRKRQDEFRALGDNPELDAKGLHATRAALINDLRKIFGENSEEFARYEHWDIYGTQRQLSGRFSNPTRSAERDEKAYRIGIGKTLTELEWIIKDLQKRTAQ